MTPSLYIHLFTLKIRHFLSPIPFRLPGSTIYSVQRPRRRCFLLQQTHNLLLGQRSQSHRRHALALPPVAAATWQLHLRRRRSCNATASISTCASFIRTPLVSSFHTGRLDDDVARAVISWPVLRSTDPGPVPSASSTAGGTELLRHSAGYWGGQQPKLATSQAALPRCSRSRFCRA